MKLKHTDSLVDKCLKTQSNIARMLEREDLNSDSVWEKMSTMIRALHTMLVRGREFYLALIATGFTDDQAMEITLNWHGKLIDNVREPEAFFNALNSKPS